ncbi:hypothetical protein [Burkholderia gladioli]|uniref:hypothetical protein n=1 Tax=Burkholderia gladioli TaxID=28095 RepID=UPI00191702A0|nr:hypothetical protein [Burkholderia gladioli]
MAVAKGQMMSARVEPQPKAVPQAAAKAEVRSLANMEEKIVVAYCRVHGYLLSGESGNALRTAVQGSGE